MTISNEQIHEDLYQGYFDAREHKRNTLAALNFEIFFEHQLEDLYTELVRRTYQPLPAYCFITFDPIQREVYASQLQEKGTLFGVERYQHHLRSVTNNFTQEAWVLYLDLSGYFMSIDKELVIKTVMFEVYKHLEYKSPDGRKWKQRIDPDFVEYLMHCLLDRNPSKDHIMIGPLSNWDGLPDRKCLANSPEGKGIVIGDITSQLFSNILLNIYDH